MIKPLTLLGVIFMLYLGGHALYGYAVCVKSEWAQCPSQTIDGNNSDEEDEE